MRAIDLLSSAVRECVVRRGFLTLSPVQEEAIPPIHTGAHTLLLAPTGTGKTESAMIPVFDSMLRETGSGFSTLYITPLRSLNRDMLSRLKWWGGELGITVGVRHGDTPASERRKQAVHPPDLLITTPETLQALFMGKVLRKHLTYVRHVIIDEIHELAGSKRGAQLAIALERLVEYAGEYQRIGLSATVGNPEDVASFLCGSSRQCTIIRVPVAKQISIEVHYTGDSFERQAAFVGDAIDRHGSILVFVNTRVTAEALGHALYSRGDVEVHHGSLSREVRIEAEERFKAGDIRALICTSSMELGIDIGHVGHVIQFGSPREVARIVQRVGRAGHRIDTVSRGTILATGFDDLLESLVIARRAHAGEVEDVVSPVGAADVLANQIAALAVEYGEIPLGRVSAIIGRTSLYPDLAVQLPEVCTQMAGHRLIRLEGPTIITTARARRYLSATLSMIHDERKVPVFDMITRKTVGTLDESFVVGWVHTGAVFVTKGQLWRVLDMEDGRITVEPARHARGEIPSWEGEQIPVPFAVAREAGALRRERDFSRYTSDKVTQAVAERVLAEMEKNRTTIPDDRVVVLEYGGEGVVCNICAGHRANEALARSLSALISARSGSTVGIEIDAYRILLRLPPGTGAVQVQEVLLSLDPRHVAGILELSLKRTALYKWKLVQVAKKFGAIDPDADFERLSAHTLSDLFERSVVQKEAYRELFSDYMDVAMASSVLAGMREGKIRVVTGPASIIGSAGLFSSRDQVPPPDPDQAVISTLRRRIDKQEIILACMHCRKWKSHTTVARAPEVPECPLCGARLIAVVKPWDEPLISLASKKGRNSEERQAEQRLLRNAHIVLSSGKKAVTALAAKGVGPENASRILATLAEGDGFYKEILKAERTFIRTHRFW